MEKKIEDYFHLYLGCQVEFGYPDKRKIGKLEGNDVRYGWQIGVANVIVPYHNVRSELITLILRPLSSMTEEEKEHLGVTLKQGTWNISDAKYYNRFGDAEYSPSAEAYRYCLSRSFDLFGLIEAGLAIDSTKQL